MRPEELNQIFKRAKKKLGGYPIHPHLFRHHWATSKVLDQESPPLIKRWGGWKHTDMIDYYCSLGEEMVGAIKPKRSVLQTIPIPGKRGRGRRPKSAAS